MAPSTVRRIVLMTATCVAVLLVFAACSSPDEPEGTAVGRDPDVLQAEVAAGVATQSAIQQQIDASVAATMTAQAPAPTLAPIATDDTKGDEPAEPTREPTVPAPTATPEPPAPTTPPPPPAPTATPVPPPPAPTATPLPPTPTEVPPTPTQAPDDVLVFDRPNNGYLTASGRNGSFAQASGSFDVQAYPARTYIRSGVYFGLGEDVTGEGILTNSFTVADAADPHTVRVSVDVGWNGELRTNGWGDMHSTFEVRLAIVDADGRQVSAPLTAGQASIGSSTASKPVSGNRRLSVEAQVEGGQTYTIRMVAVCRSHGSGNIWASDTECIFDQYDGVNGFVEWKNLQLD